MDPSQIQENLPIILAIIGLIILQFFLRRRKPEVTRQEIARNLLIEVKLDQALAASHHLRSKPKKFEAVVWQRNKNKLDFLPQPLQTALSDAFLLVTDFNQQIDTAKKQKSGLYMLNINMDKIQNSLEKSKQGLEEWLQKNTGTKEPPPQYPGIIDSLFGGR